MGSLETDGGGTSENKVDIQTANITTLSTQHYGELVYLTGPTTLSASTITFEKPVDGDDTLTVNAKVTLNGISNSITTVGTQIYSDTITLAAPTTLTSTAGTLDFVLITDGASAALPNSPTSIPVFNLTLETGAALVFGNVDIGGNLQVTTHSGGVSPKTVTDTNTQIVTPVASLKIGGTARFTADTGLEQIAELTHPSNEFKGKLIIDQINDGSWADVTVVTASSLDLAPLQSAGTVTLNTSGALTTDSITTTGSLVVNSHGHDVSLGAATVSVDMMVQSDGGNVIQTGPFTVTGNTVVTAGAGMITLDYEALDTSVNPPLYVSNTFGGNLALTGDSTTVATSGNLQLGSVNNTGPMSLRAPVGSIDLGTAFITGGDLTLISRDDMNLGGANISGDLRMTSTAGNVSFGSATVAGNLIANTQGGTVDLGNAFVGRNLDVQTQGGDIIQSATTGASLSVMGTSNLNAGSGNITLPNMPNQFADAITLQAKNVELVATNGLILANGNVTGTLNVTAATGNITQTAALNVTGETTFTATQGDVVLDQANTFASPVIVDTVNATIHAASPLTMGTSTVTGDLVAKVTQGDITQVGALTVSGKADITTTAGNVTLQNMANTFADKVSVNTSGTLSLTASGPLTLDKVTTVGDTVLQSHGILNLGTSTFGAKLKANSGGFDIVQTGPIRVIGNSDFDAGNAKIDLYDPKNFWSGAIIFKAGIVMINHPQLLNAVSAGALVVRVETSMGAVQMARVGVPVNTPVSAKPSTDGNSVSISVTPASSGGQTGVIAVAVSAEAAAPGRSFSFSIESHVPATAATADVKVMQVDGKPLPDWLRYEPSTKTFVATTVPPGAFPLQLKVGIGGVETLMVINEKPPGK